MILLIFFHKDGKLIWEILVLIDLQTLAMEKIKEESLKINPDLIIFPVSCKTGEGLEEWFNWLKERVKEKAQSWKNLKTNPDRINRICRIIFSFSRRKVKGIIVFLWKVINSEVIFVVIGIWIFYILCGFHFSFSSGKWENK